MKAIGYRGILDIGYRFDAGDGALYTKYLMSTLGSVVHFGYLSSINGIDVARGLYLDFTGQTFVTGGALPG